ncbi:MAG: chromate efflux transporter [Cyanobacteria bacterium KgW148]|nr:chromate efflux transporter [Cyanobacteria bacterium KgW148]
MEEVEVLESSVETKIPDLTEMTWLFLKLGSIGFGGGIAMIALIEDEFVKRRSCLETEEFLHGVALSQILGSFPVNTALFVGYRLHGFLGGLLSSMVFLFPSFFAVIVLSWLYFSFNTIPSLQGVLSGLAPVVIAIILTAAWSMGQKAIGSYVALGLAIGGCIATLTKVNPVLILSVGGIVGLLLKLTPRKPQPKKTTEQSQAAIGLPLAMEVLPHEIAQLADKTSAPATISLVSLGLTFLKVGFVFFGGGFVLIPILKQLLIDNLHWLTQQEFIDGVAISQLTPGPIAVISTFAGFRVAGLTGAVIATIGLFLPSIVLMFILANYYQKVRHLQPVKHFLSGVNPTVVGMIVSAAINLAPSILPIDQPIRIGINLALLGIGLLVIVKLKWHPAIGLAIGAITGVIIGFIPGLN